MKTSKHFQDTDLCVKCGLCVPHCPTYRKTLNENESPRGRIALIQAWSKGNLEDTPALRGHLDNCLLCRTCESLCPAQVPYARLLDRFRSTVGKGRQSIPVKVLSAISKTVLPSKRLSGIAARIANELKANRIMLGLSARFSLARRIQGIVDEIRFPQAALQPLYATRYPRRGRVGLFTGCTGALFDANTIDAAIRVLDRLGYDVSVPREQSCCGALHLHAGDADGAGGFARRNLAAFQHNDLQAIVSLATGCGAMLKEYPAYFPDSENFSARVTDICEFVRQSDQRPNIKLEPLDADIMIHTPCSLANVLKTPEGPAVLVAAIPGIRITRLDQSFRCCGAAGTYMLEHPEMARALRQDLLDAVAEQRPDYLLTTNIGCALHLKDGIRQQNLRTKVVHPIVLFGRQIQKSE